MRFIAFSLRLSLSLSILDLPRATLRPGNVSQMTRALVTRDAAEASASVSAQQQQQPHHADEPKTDVTNIRVVNNNTRTQRFHDEAAFSRGGPVHA